MLACWVVLLLGGCERDPVPATEVVVELSAAAALTDVLSHIEVTVFKSGARDGDAPADRRNYALRSGAPGTAVTPPFSFSIERRVEDRFLLVVSGFRPGDAQAMIEAKRLVSFEERRSLLFKLTLGGECLDQVCSTLAQTCGAGVCSDVPEALTTPFTGARDLSGYVPDGAEDAGQSVEAADAGTGVDADAAAPHPDADAVGSRSDADSALDRDSARPDGSAAEAGMSDAAVGSDASGDSGPAPVVCPAQACMPGGSCVSGTDSWSCNCNQGFKGTGSQQCEPATYCPEDACAPNGQCVDQKSWYCQCNVGFSGTACEIDSCAALSCAKGQRCHRTLGQPFCEACPLGFSGANCEIDACSSANNPCKNGAACERAAGGVASCNCSGTGYKGASCDQIDVCSLCTKPEYPCVVPKVQTNPPSYTCQGQYAEWPMPDATPGAARKPSYDTTSTAGVVIDKVTGLWWQRFLPGATGSSETAYAGCSYQFGCRYDDAKRYCEGLSLGGYDDWRLPSKIELESLVDVTRQMPAIDIAAFPDAPSEMFVTSSKSPGPNQFLYVHFADGSSNDAFDLERRVRCTRGAVSLSPGQHPGNRYAIDVLANTAKDTRTGLTWQRVLGSGSYTPATGQTHCQSIGGGYRLPTIKELLTLADSSQGDMAVDPKVLPPPPNYNSVYSSNMYVADSKYGWALDSRGHSYSQDTTIAYVISARCVK